MNHQELKYLTDIAEIYGCKILFKKMTGGYFDSRNRSITIGTNDDNIGIISTFCHELGHFFNFKRDKYKIYHDNDLFVKFVNKSTTDQIIKYALSAEIYTEKIGKEICKEWFPDIKYRIFYRKNDRYTVGYLHGYYQNIKG